MTEAEQAGPDPLLGLNLAGKYKIVKLLGEGGMGCVYLGEQLMGTAVRKVAVKTLHRHLSMDPQIRARFSRECGTVAELEHPNTIQVYDFGTTEDGLLYIVMEFVQGRSLADILEKDGPMPADRVLDILGQVCGSLEEAHGRGIIHRDLKPDNVVLCEKAGRKDWVEVLDFGIAKRSTESDPNEQKLTQQGMVLGTPPYMSPEQFTGQPIKQTSDIYSLGVMTYEMLTGRLPFNGNTAWEWASQHMTAQPQPLEVQPNGNLLPPAMRSAIMRALEKSPEARFATAGAFLDALKGNGAAVAAPGPSSGGGRPKTEMASPMEMPPGMAAGFAAGPASGGPGTQPGTPMGGPPMGGPPMGGPPMGGPPMGGPPMGGPPMGQPPGMGAPAPAAFVPPSQHQSGGARRGGGAGLYIGLGVGALALVGVIIAAVVMRSGRKEDPTTTATTGAVPSSTPTTASSPTTAPSDEHHDNTPLSALNTPTAAAGGQAVPAGGGKGGTVKPIPTPGKNTTGPTNPTTPTVKPQPQVCQSLRSMNRNHPAYQSLVAQCKAAGGTPP